MTETEARTKVCKIGGIIQAIFTVAAATIRGDTAGLKEKVNAIGFCCASDCATGWRWDKPLTEGCIVDGEDDPCKCVLDDKQYTKDDCSYAARGKTQKTCGYWRDKHDSNSGYCGIGGPQ